MQVVFVVVACWNLDILENVHDARPTSATSVAGVIGGYAAAAFFEPHA